MDRARPRFEARRPALDVTVDVVGTASAGPFQDAVHGVIGISPFNAYFAEWRIHVLLAWAVSTFDHVDVMLPGPEAADTLYAAGTPRPRAVRRCREEIRRMMNRARRAVAATGAEIDVWTWDRFAGHPEYTRLHERGRAAYDEDPAFRGECLATTRAVLTRAAVSGRDVAPEAADLAVNYWLAELPFLVDSPAILGVPSSVFCYHQVIPFCDALYHHKLAVVPSPRQGYAVVTVPDSRSPVT